MTTDHVQANLRKGVAEYCVLALVQDEPSYGLRLAARLQEEGLIGNESTMYPLMARLLSSGLVDSSWQASDAGRPRKYYTITDDGRAALEAFRASWVPLRDAVDRALRVREVTGS